MESHLQCPYLFVREKQSRLALKVFNTAQSETEILSMDHHRCNESMNSRWPLLQQKWLCTYISMIWAIVLQVCSGVPESNPVLSCRFNHKSFHYLVHFEHITNKCQLTVCYVWDMQQTTAKCRTLRSCKFDMQNVSTCWSSQVCRLSEVIFTIPLDWTRPKLILGKNRKCRIVHNPGTKVVHQRIGSLEIAVHK